MPILWWFQGAECIGFSFSPQGAAGSEVRVVSELRRKECKQELISEAEKFTSTFSLKPWEVVQQTWNIYICGSITIMSFSYKQIMYCKYS